MKALCVLQALCVMLIPGEAVRALWAAMAMAVERAETPKPALAGVLQAPLEA